MGANKLSNKYTVILVVVALIVTYLLIKTKPQPEAKLEPPTPMRVVVTRVEATDFEPRFEVSGYLRPGRQARLRFEVMGEVAERRVEPGEKVAAGALLLRLDEGDYRDAVLEAEARLRQEEAGVARDRRLLDLARRNRQLQEEEVARQQRLGSESLASRTALDNARQKLFQLASEEERLKYSVETAQARLDLQQANLNRARRNLDRCRLTAPFAGVVNRVEVDVGDGVNANQTVAELIDTSFLDLYVEVGGEVAAALRVGQAARVAVADRLFDGELVAIQPDPAAETFTHEVRIRLANPGLLPGQPARATLALPTRHDVLVVPVTAIVRDGGEDYLFVVDGTRLEKRRVRLGARRGGEQIVLDGVRAGEQIVARDAAALTTDVAIEY